MNRIGNGLENILIHVLIIVGSLIIVMMILYVFFMIFNQKDEKDENKPQYITYIPPALIKGDKDKTYICCVCQLICDITNTKDIHAFDIELDRTYLCFLFATALSECDSLKQSFEYGMLYDKRRYYRTYNSIIQKYQAEEEKYNTLKNTEIKDGLKEYDAISFGFLKILVNAIGGREDIFNEMQERVKYRLEGYQDLELAIKEDDIEEWQEDYGISEINEQTSNQTSNKGDS